MLPGTLPFLLLALASMQLPVVQRPAPLARTLVLGDSWAYLLAPRVQRVLQLAGRADDRVVNASVPGQTAAALATPASLAAISDQLAGEPTIDTVLLLTGVNDLGSGWSTALSPAAASVVVDTVGADIDAIVRHCLGERAHLEVLLVGTDFPNFVETLVTDPTGRCVPLWTQLGQPTPAEMNAVLIALDGRRRALAEADARVTHVDFLGLMQLHFGYPGLSIPPFAPTLPDPTLPSPPESLGLLGADCIHLSTLGYDILASVAYAGFFDAQLGAPYLGGPVPGRAGVVNVLHVRELRPGDAVFLAVGTQVGSTVLAGCPGLVLAIAQPSLLSCTLADAYGNARFVAGTPLALAGVTLHLQALQPASCTTTNPVAWTF